MNNLKVNPKLSKTKSNFNSLKQLAACKQKKMLSSSISKLQEFKTFYDQRYISQSHRNLTPKIQAQNAEQQQLKPQKGNKMFEANFEVISKKLCSDTIFQLKVFLSVNGEGHRNKLVLSRLYGYTEQLGGILFPNKRSQLRVQFSKEDLYLALGFNSKTFKTRNNYNKQRLFLVQLQGLNKRQQDIQGKLIKIRMNDKLSQIDHEMKDMVKSKQKTKRYDISNYINDIQKTHNIMINNKLKIHNRRDDVRDFQIVFGKIQVNNYYIKQQKAINDIEDYFTKNRLNKFP